MSWMDGRTLCPGRMEGHRVLDEWNDTVSWTNGRTPCPGRMEEHCVLVRWKNTISWTDVRTPSPGRAEGHNLLDGWKDTLSLNQKGGSHRDGIHVPAPLAGHVKCMVSWVHVMESRLHFLLNRSNKDYLFSYNFSFDQIYNISVYIWIYLT